MKALKKGDKVVFVKNIGMNGSGIPYDEILKVGHTYTVKEMGFETITVFIVLEEDDRWIFSVDAFKTLKEYRKEKLNKINNG